MRRGRVMLAGAVIAALVLALVSIDRIEPTGRASGLTSAVDRAPDVVALSADAIEPAAHAGPVAAGIEQPPRSQQDSEADGRIGFDANGNLILDADLRRRFDWYLAAIGEQDLATIRRRFASELADSLDAQEAAKVMQAFDRYLSYLTGIETLRAEHDLALRFEALRAYRRSALGMDMADAFFADEEAYTAYSLAQRAREAGLLGENPDELREQLPGDLREALAEHERVRADVELVRALDDPDLDPTARADLIEQAFGDEAASRLAALASERAAWQQRMAEYQTERERLLTDPTLGTAEREHALTTLREARFSEAERRRVIALESVENGG